MAPAMLCKTCKKSKHRETRGKTNDFKSKFACLLEASESTRMRMEESLPNFHEEHIAGRGDNSLQHYTVVLKFIPMLQAMKIPAAKAAVDKEWEKHAKIPAWNLTKVRSKKEVIDEARTKGMKVQIASLMDICHLKTAELETKHHKYKGRVVLRGDIVKDDSGSYAVFTEQGSSAPQMTAVKWMSLRTKITPTISPKKKLTITRVIGGFVRTRLVPIPCQSGTDLTSKNKKKKLNETNDGHEAILRPGGTGKVHGGLLILAKVTMEMYSVLIGQKNLINK